MTRQTQLIDGTKASNRVDKRLDDPLRSGQEPCKNGQGREGTGVVICEDTWSEFILIAEYLFRTNNEAEVADVFEWFRMEDLGGEQYSLATMKRATREVVTDCGAF